MSVTLSREFTTAAVRKLKQDFGQLKRCAALLDDAQIWQRANENCNSVANLLLHLNGNLTQWMLAGLGGESFDRDRPAEFAARGGISGAVLTDQLGKTIERASTLISGLDASALEQRRIIQGYDVSTLAAVFHVVEHVSFHTGQVIQITKELRNVNLALFDEQGRRAGVAGGEPW